MKGTEAAVPRLTFALCPARIPPAAVAILPEAYHVRIKNAIVGQPIFLPENIFTFEKITCVPNSLMPTAIAPNQIPVCLFPILSVRTHKTAFNAHLYHVFQN